MLALNDVFAAILVGGRGSRLGTVDKAQLKLSGSNETLFERLTRVLAPAVAEIVVVGRREQSALYRDSPYRFVADQQSGAGPLAGLQAALRSAPVAWCFLVACDMPKLDASIVDYLAKQREPNRAVVPRTTRGLEPTCALYPRSYVTHVDAALVRGLRAVYTLLAQTDVIEVELPPDLEPKLRNINTAQDLRTQL